MFWMKPNALFIEYVFSWTSNEKTGFERKQILFKNNYPYLKNIQCITFLRLLSSRSTRVN